MQKENAGMASVNSCLLIDNIYFYLFIILLCYIFIVMVVLISTHTHKHTISDNKETQSSASAQHWTHHPLMHSLWCSVHTATDSCGDPRLSPGARLLLPIRHDYCRWSITLTLWQQHKLLVAVVVASPAVCWRQQAPIPQVTQAAATPFVLPWSRLCNTTLQYVHLRE